MRFLSLLVVVAALSVAGVASGANPPPGNIGAQQTCKMLGYAIGTDTFTSCVQSTVNGSTPPAASSARTTQPKIHLARQTCLKSGLTKGTAAFTRCVNHRLKLASH